MPDGGDVENCAAIDHTGAGTMNDLNCGQKLCTVCELDERPSLTLRGACLDTM